MKAIIRLTGLLIGFLSISVPSYPQCEILNRMAPDGSMQYYMQPVNFYWTEAKSLEGCIVTDRENYFLLLRPIPFPEKPAGNKLREDLVLTMSNDTAYTLKHFDTRYIENDTVMAMLFLIDQKDMNIMLKFEVIEAKIDMKGEEGVRSYEFKLHKSALKDQLACFLKDEEARKKK
jgi:hypothetical protein